MRSEVLGVPAPPKPEQYDKKCPFYGEIDVKKETLVGVVVKRDTNRSATIEWFRPYYIPKFERYEVRRSRLRVHNPTSVDAQVGQQVLVARTRPLSKTKHHVILKVLTEKGIMKMRGVEQQDAFATPVTATSSSKKTEEKKEHSKKENPKKELKHTKYHENESSS